jgi:Omp85 superfamily domain
MRYAWLGCLVFGSLLVAAPQDAEVNVNARYTVESVILSGKGWTTNLRSETTDKISLGLRHELVALIGQKLNPSSLDSLAANLKKELSAREVTHRIVRAQNPEEVRVEFEVKSAKVSADLNLDQFVYDSKQGWSGSGAAGLTVGQHSFSLGLVSDGDWLNERYAGFRGHYEDKRLLNDRISFRFQVESYHDQWNTATLTALAEHPSVTSGAYRARQNFQPSITISLAKPLSLEVGARVERFENEDPAVGTEGSNALITTLRYHRRFDDSDNQQDLDADLSLHAATRALGSDFVYSMRTAGVRYQFRHGKHTVTDNVWTGMILGRAPLSDRFVMGNTYYLRGWNKYEIDPLGGNRAVHNSVEYRYGPLQLFYDAGAIWDAGQQATPRQSLGFGLHESVFSLAVAFPVRSGHIEPIFMMGILP